VAVVVLITHRQQVVLVELAAAVMVAVLFHLQPLQVLMAAQT
jgi:hypothetical protein